MSPAGGERRLVAPLLALATLVAAALRLPFLNGSSWWFDESYTVRVLGAGSPDQLWERIGASESTPPLFYGLAWCWSQLIGDRGEATLRSVSAAATIAAVPLAYVALRRLAGWRAALGAAALLAVSPVLVGYALDARAYGLLVLMSVLSVWGVALLLERPTRWRFTGWALAAAGTIWTHWFGGFLVLGEAVALLWLVPAARRGTLLACAAVGVALLPLLGLLRDQTGDERAGFIDGFAIGERLEQLARQFAMGANVPRTWLEAAGLALLAGGTLAGGLIALRAATRRGPASAAAPAASPPLAAAPAALPAPAEPVPPRDGARALLAITLVALLVPLALALLDLYDRFSIRNVLYLLPLVAAIAALGLLRLRAIPLAAYLALGILAVVWVHTDWRYDRTDWRAALGSVRAQGGGEDPVIAASTLGQPVASLYLDRAATGAPLRTRRAWLVVEPVRGVGQRALAPVGAAVEEPLAALFPQRRERIVRGFRVIELTAPAPVVLDPAALPGAALYPADAN